MALRIVEKADRVTTSRNEAWFDTLLEKLPTAGYACDPEGLITSYNDSVVELWGRAPALNDPADRYCGSFRLFTVEGERIPHDRCWMALALRHRREYRGQEFLIEHPDGSLRRVLAHANPVLSASGTLLGAVNVLLDVTEHKRVEQALDSQTRELQRLNGELRAKVDEIACADRRVDEFLAQLAHELRNPLSPITTAVETMRLKGSQSREQSLLERQLGHLRRLTEDLLDLSRATQGKLRVERRPMLLAEAVGAAVEASRPTIESHDQHLDVRVAHESVCVEGDLVRLTQAVTNLLTNAAKFTGRGGRIDLSVERIGDEAVVRVEDTGMGLASDELPHVFDMFFQSSRCSSDRHGLGVGLALVKRLVELHGGAVEASSRGPGTGSAFLIRLPVSAADRKGELTSGAAPDSGRCYRLLVADDNADAADSLAELLELLGHEVHVAYDGRRALETAARQRPELLLLDLGMPRLDGYEVCRRVRREPWGEQMFVIALTGWGGDEDRARTAAAGFDAHLVKPADLGTVRAALSDFAARVASGRPCAPSRTSPV